jgi:hypothetical protein
MARPRMNEKHIAIAIEGLVGSIRGLVEAIAATARATTPVAPHVKIPGQRGPGKNNPKLKAAIKASWARMTDAERKARVKKMLAGRGIKQNKKK